MKLSTLIGVICCDVEVEVENGLLFADDVFKGHSMDIPELYRSYTVLSILPYEEYLYICLQSKE